MPPPDVKSIAAMWGLSMLHMGFPCYPVEMRVNLKLGKMSMEFGMCFFQNKSSQEAPSSADSQ